MNVGDTVMRLFAEERSSSSLSISEGPLVRKVKEVLGNLSVSLIIEALVRCNMEVDEAIAQLSDKAASNVDRTDSKEEDPIVPSDVGSSMSQPMP
ncbi:hypothetical protein MKW98_012741, partial [Papaver atlanticum]